MPDIIKTPDNPIDLPATAEDFGETFAVEGRGDIQPQISRVAMYAGTAQEEAAYGTKFKRGEFFDTLEIRSLGNTISIMPLFAWATYAQWNPGETRPVAVWDDRKKVPAELLKFSDDGRGGKTRPAVQETINCVCVVVAENGELQPYPYLFAFKSTGLRAWDRTIAPNETRRKMANKTPMMYAMSSVDDKNASGQPFKRLTARPGGEPSAAAIDLGRSVFAQAKASRRAAESVAAEHDQFDPGTD